MSIDPRSTTRRWAVPIAFAISALVTGPASAGHYHSPHHGLHVGVHVYPGYAWGWPYGSWGYWGVGGPYLLPVAAYDADAPGAVETDVHPKKAEVLVDGFFVGQARDYNGRWDLLWLAPGEHVIEFRREGFLTLRRTIEVRAGMQLRLDERLQEGEGDDPRSSLAERAAVPEAAEAPEAPSASLERGLLRLEIEPADAAVYLDGEFLARADELRRLHGALPVARGVHTLEVVRPGYESRTLEVDVSGEEPLRVEIGLEKRR